MDATTVWGLVMGALSFLVSVLLSILAFVFRSTLASLQAKDTDFETRVRAIEGKVTSAVTTTAHHEALDLRVRNLEGVTARAVSQDQLNEAERRIREDLKGEMREVKDELRSIGRMIQGPRRAR